MTDSIWAIMRRLSAILLALLVLTLAACQPVAVDEKDGRPAAVTLISEAEQNGDLRTAADRYLEQAADHEGALRSGYSLRAAIVLLKLGDYERADTALQQISLSDLNASDQINAAILRADVAIYQDDAGAALTALDSVDMAEASASQQQQSLKLRIDAYEISDNMLDKALAHIDLNTLLPANERTQNQDALWEALMQLDIQQLDLFNPGQPPEEGSGWFALAYAIKAYEGNPEATEVALEDWQRNYPNHPADVEKYRKLIKSSGTSLPDKFDNVAVLLPESGPIAGAAQAVKQGIIAAHLSSGQSRQLKFYAIKSDPTRKQTDVVARYRQAVDDGASVVIGPLDKYSVEQLASEDSLKIPVLALNQIGDKQAHDNIFQFGLVPEDDARAAAKYAADQGYRRALVLGPQNAWGERVVDAFTEAWRQRDGTIVRSSSYRESINDFRDIIVPLFALNASQQRYEQLRNTLGRSLEFEPRRRQDVDFIFLVAKPLKARQLVPQFRFHRSGNLPVVTTSHAYGGEPDARQNIDLNSTIISDIPWMIGNEQDAIYRGLANQASGDKGTYMRLAALGVDAYHLLDQLKSLRSSGNNAYQGMTGSLSLNEKNQIQRMMPQGIFVDGLLEPLTGQR